MPVREASGVFQRRTRRIMQCRLNRCRRRVRPTCGWRRCVLRLLKNWTLFCSQLLKKFSRRLTLDRKCWPRFLCAVPRHLCGQRLTSVAPVSAVIVGCEWRHRMTYELREVTSSVARRSLSDKSSPVATDSGNELILAANATLHVRIIRILCCHLIIDAIIKLASRDLQANTVLAILNVLKYHNEVMRYSIARRIFKKENEKTSRYLRNIWTYLNRIS